MTTTSAVPAACPVCGKKVPKQLAPEVARELLAKHMRKHVTESPPQEAEPESQEAES